MSEFSDKIAYMKGLSAGLKLEADSPEHKLMLAIADALSALASEVTALRGDHEELKEYVDVMDEDVSELEDEVYGDDDDLDLDDDESDDDESDDDESDDDESDDDVTDEDVDFTVDDDSKQTCDACDDEGCHCGHEHGVSEAMLDQPLAERECPNCGKAIHITLRALLNKDEPIICPSCGSKFRAADKPDDR